MKTDSTGDATTRFEALFDTMQRELVVITKNNPLVGIMIALNDASDTRIPERFMEKEAGYDEWFNAQVSESLKAFKVGTTTLTEHEQALDCAWARAWARANTASD